MYSHNYAVYLKYIRVHTHTHGYDQMTVSLVFQRQLFAQAANVKEVTVTWHKCTRHVIQK